MLAFSPNPSCVQRKDLLSCKGVYPDFCIARSNSDDPIRSIELCACEEQTHKQANLSILISQSLFDMGEKLVRLKFD